MQLHPDFVLQQMPGDMAVLVPTGEAGERYRGIVRLNETAAFIVERLQQDTTREQIVAALGEEYEGDEKDFAASVDHTVSELKKVGAILD